MLAVPLKVSTTMPGAQPSRHTVSLAGSYSTCRCRDLMHAS